MTKNKSTQTSMQFHFINPADEVSKPEKGTVTITIDSLSPNVHEMVTEDASFEDAVIEFLKDQLCIENGVVLSDETFNLIKE